MMFFGFFYTVGLHLYALGMIPKLLMRSKKVLFLEKLGKNFPHIEKKGKKLLWIHAISLGETKAVTPLIQKLKEKNPNLLILLTATTQTGYEEGKKTEADYRGYFPFDFPYVIRPIVRKICPDTVILTETDFWYHFQTEVKKQGAKLVVVNGKISERSFKRLQKLPFLSKNLLGPIDTFFLQGEEYRDRFQKLGISPSKLSITGNIKLDGIESKKMETSDLILTLGSTHDPEESIWIEALKKIWLKFPNLKVMMVPRHPERFDTVAKLLASHQISFGRASLKDSLETHPVLLVDTMGILRSCYQKSTIAFVGGSFTPKVGGHNILEPCFYGKPVLFGPYMHSQPDFLDLIRSYNAGVQISTETLVPTVEKFLSSPSLCSSFGDRGLEMVASSRGALGRTLNHLMKILVE